MSTVISSPPNIEQVLQVICSLYANDGNKSESKEMASSWLEALQKSVYAWEIADQLLIKKPNVECCYFAAQTLRTKLENNFNELPHDSYIPLKNSILNHLKNIDEDVIQTQLAISITYLMIQVPSWTNPIEEMVSSDLNRHVLVEVLTILPEEMDQSRCQNLKGIGVQRRQHLRQYLRSIAPQIIHLLHTSLIEAQRQLPEHSTQKLTSKIFRSLGSWLNIISSTDISCIEPLLEAIFNSLKDPATSDFIHDAAADTICSSALLCENYENYKHLTHYLLDHIYQLEGVYLHSVSCEDIDKSVNYSRIFTEIAESIVSPLLIESALAGDSGPNSGLKLVDLLLECIKHYDYEVAEITFHFWYRLSELIHKQQGPLPNLFAPVIDRLLIGLTSQCTLDSDLEGILGSENDIMEFRGRVKDLMKEVVTIIGPSRFLRNNGYLPKLQILLAGLAVEPIDWEEAETILFIISALAQLILHDTPLVNEIIKIIMSTNPFSQQQNLGENETQKALHPQILATCCVILKELKDWIGAQPSNIFNMVLDYLFPLITTNFSPSGLLNENKSDNKSNLSAIAASALQTIISCCAENHLSGNKNVVEMLIRICTHFDSLNENAARDLLLCCSIIISKGDERRTRREQEDLVVKLLTPNVEALKKLVSGTSLVNQRLDPVIYLDRISSVFKNLSLKPASHDLTSPLNNLVQEIWSIITTILNHVSNSTNFKLVERTCRCLRYIFRCLRPVWLLIPVADCIVSLYQQNAEHSSYLYLASVLVDEFADPEGTEMGSADKEKIVNGLVSMLEAFCVPTFALLTSSGVKLRNYPETIDDFFRLCDRFIMKNPVRFLRCSLVETIFNLTIASIELDDREANKTVCRFICDFLSLAKPTSMTKQLVENLLNSFGSNETNCLGQRIVNTVINAGLFHLQPSFITEMAEILFRLMEWDKPKLLSWLQKTLTSLPVRNEVNNIAATPQNLEEFYESISKAVSIKLVVSSFRSLSRAYR